MKKTEPKIRITILLTVLAVMLLSASAKAESTPAARSKITVTCWACPVGIGPYEQIAAVNHVVNSKHPWLRLKVETTPGGYAQPNAVLNPPDPAQLPFVYTTYPEGDLEMIKRGWLAREERKLPFEDLRSLGGLMMIGILFVTFDPNIKKIEDLPGKHIGLGFRSQSVIYAYPVHFLEEMYGMKDKDMKYHVLGPIKSAEALISGRVDVAVIMFVADRSLKQIVSTRPLEMAAATGRKLYYIPIPEEKIKLFYQKTSVAYFPTTFPVGALLGQAEPYTTAFSLTLAQANKYWSNEIAYEFTKTLANYHKDIGAYHALGKLLTREMISSEPNAMPWHPGSERALKELGWIK